MDSNTNQSLLSPIRVRKKSPLPSGWSWIIFVRALSGGPVYIGKTNNVIQRLSQMQACCPVVLDVVAFYPKPGEEEGKLHTQFQADHLYGKWYRPSKRLMAWIQEIADRYKPDQCQ